MLPKWDQEDPAWVATDGEGRGAAEGGPEAELSSVIHHATLSDGERRPTARSRPRADVVSMAEPMAPFATATDALFFVPRFILPLSTLLSRVCLLYAITRTRRALANDQNRVQYSAKHSFFFCFFLLLMNRSLAWPHATHAQVP